MSFLSYYFNHLFFNVVHSNLNHVYNRKMSNNFTSLTHATGSTLLAWRYLLDTKNMDNYYNLISYSSAYFIYDLLYLIQYWEPKPLNYAYIYHHLSSLYIIHQNPQIYYGGHILFLGELSNIPSYFVYYYQKQPNKQNLVKKLKYLQFFLYSFIRVPLMTKLIKDIYYNSQNTGNYTTLLVGTPVYLLGLIWTKKLFSKLY